MYGSEGGMYGIRQRCTGHGVLCVWASGGMCGVMRAIMGVLLPWPASLSQAKNYDQHLRNDHLSVDVASVVFMSVMG